MPENHKTGSEKSTNLTSKLNANATHSQMLKYISTLAQKAANSEAIGIRLTDGLDFPYFYTKGFSKEHIEEEMYLKYAAATSDSTPCLECLCGCVLSGSTDCIPCFTPFGSVFINQSDDLNSLIQSWQKVQRPLRGKCIREGYESIALIPVKSNNRIYGLFQLNDKRSNIFSREIIACLESMASCLGILFDSLSKPETKPPAIIARYETLETLTKELITHSSNTEYSNAIIKKLTHLLYPLEDLQGVIPSCCCCKRICCDNGKWMSLEQYISEHSHLSFSHTYCPECFASEFEKRL